MLKRTTCATCLRAQSSCICHWVTPVASRVEVLILQHPLEVRETKGTARLLHLSLACSRLVVGEVFEEVLLKDWLIGDDKTAVLLYPDLPEDTGLDLLKPPTLAPELLQNPEQLRLVVLDGTWRKSRKMLYMNPLLQGLPRLPLRDMPASNYRIRKAHLPDQLSTLEATCAALAELEGQSAHVAPLLAAFDGFVQQLVSQQASFELKQA